MRLDTHASGLGCLSRLRVWTGSSLESIELGTPLASLGCVPLDLGNGRFATRTLPILLASRCHQHQWHSEAVLLLPVGQGCRLLACHERNRNGTRVWTRTILALHVQQSRESVEPTGKRACWAIGTKEHHTIASPSHKDPFLASKNTKMGWFVASCFHKAAAQPETTQACLGLSSKRWKLCNLQPNKTCGLDQIQTEFVAGAPKTTIGYRRDSPLPFTKPTNATTCHFLPHRQQKGIVTGI